MCVPLRGVYRAQCMCPKPNHPLEDFCVFGQTHQDFFHLVVRRSVQPKVSPPRLSGGSGKLSGGFHCFVLIPSSIISDVCSHAPEIKYPLISTLFKVLFLQKHLHSISILPPQSSSIITLYYNILYCYIIYMIILLYNIIYYIII